MNFLDIMRHRFACKLYDVDKPLSQEEIDEILEYGRLTPTSFGLEMWHFHTVVSKEKLNELYAVCYEQEGVRTSGMTVAILVKTPKHLDPDGSFVHERGIRFPSDIDWFVEDYRPYHEFLKKNDRLEGWLRSQGYLAVANMMTGARSLGIQSCAIEGFDEEGVLRVLGTDPEEWLVSLLCTFGHAAEEERPKIRVPLDELVTYH
ncbi:MAG: NAD(P)H-dependent oxidoreductase [Spirochaetales bacterium]|nr:NAD(P)H-dependent oxidoreductase [Spirochaetales bacterium]